MSKWKPTGHKVQDSRGQWLLVCVCTDCGRTAARRHDRVNRHCSKCRPSGPDAARKRGYARFCASCRKRGLENELSFEDWCDITSRPCYYTGRKPSNRVQSTKGDQEYIYSGIDRLDSTQGYVKGNCVPCCIQVNIAKNNDTVEDFLQMCREVASRFPE